MADSTQNPSSITISVGSDGRPTADDVVITKKNHQITWKLDTGTAADGGPSADARWNLVSIEWKPSQNADFTQFEGWEGSGGHNGKKIKVKDKCDTTPAQEMDFNYRIWVVSADGLGHPEHSADPVIKNIPE